MKCPNLSEDLLNHILGYEQVYDEQARRSLWKKVN